MNIGLDEFLRRLEASPRKWFIERRYDGKHAIRFQFGPDEVSNIIEAPGFKQLTKQVQLRVLLAAEQSNDYIDALREQLIYACFCK